MRRSRIDTPQGPGTTKDAANSRKSPTASPPQGRHLPTSPTSTSRQGHPFGPRTPVPTPANPPPELTPAHHNSLQLSKPTAARNPLGRVGEPEDIAAAVAFLASRDAAWITGTTLRVDGGLLAVNAGFRRAVAQD
ncbi:SDR family oxidoreductase [Streptomyces atratus]|uniref:SDR family oxidoreductase n=1 Tax=Streptomyces atratus TaxID=1893 RepID=UPI0033FD4CA4